MFHEIVHIPKGVCDVFLCNTSGDYQDIYNRTDIPLLADVLEICCKTRLLEYKLDPAHYHISPGLSLDDLLKESGIEHK